MAEIMLAEARALCTKAELELYQASRGKLLTAQKPAQLLKSRERARQARDKWNDLAKTQRRALQKDKGARDVVKTERSAKKAQLFQEALDRIQARIDLLPAEDVKAAAATRKPTSKAKRTVEHRASRASVRKQLSDVRDAKLVEATSAQAPTTPPAVVADVPAAAPTPVVESPPSATAHVPELKKPSKKLSVKALAKPLQQLDSQKQLRAATVAKEQRKKVSGKAHVQAHSSSRGRRNQAARDQKNKG
ncbi:hypothetical protein [Planctomicrobium piriforme]|uniref:Uncharacterized protein n=1 Tax=Planctomicrobium piriforme TaxID=1576369 RepID=A0A1I3F604_9PLAN|nr:hypothetical protein [Planctomicrobium piriforme]SFI06634.1 hypothetical protein SAMN05421753_10598 [Planctomicrobium piriforme]